ncbi:ELF5A-1 [Symbiodinium natans]|uniref:Eukaryotic translation initiation factor 5A n=1 Tax=Symbiodinium natans TaxID=878477 RepID=A0A812JMW4_9DINO|nr:ELF5A-1 [Symbiodinium natans]
MNFERTDAGASQTYQQQAGSITKGSYVMLKGHPCKIKEVNTFSPGKHGHAKAHLVGLDIFTGKKYEETSQTSHSMEVPVVTKTEYPLMNLNADTGAVSLLQDNGELKIDLNLPGAGKANEEDTLQADILRAFGNDLLITVVVIAACGMEKIVSFTATD